MATKTQCKKCHNYEDCPILQMMRKKGVKGDAILRKKCITYKYKDRK